jgi:hypothetical protein
MRRRARYSTQEVYELADLGDERAMAVARAVAKCSGRGKYATRQWKPQTKESRAARQALGVDRLHLRLAVLQRIH